ncbi:hypothetical protein ACUXHH_000975 [Rothia sp. 110740021-2]
MYRNAASGRGDLTDAAFRVMNKHCLVGGLAGDAMSWRCY